MRLAFSGGKDSIVCKRLLELAGVPFTSYYSNTTMDPPELVKFIKAQHGDVPWLNPKMPMMTAVATLPKTPPTRRCRWCCNLYKENAPRFDGLTVMGIRAEESARRKKAYKPITKMRNGKTTAMLPILRWTEEDIWQFIDDEKLPYCSLYDENGFSRLGCVGCPMTGLRRRDFEFRRWPQFERNWERAVKRSWEKWHGVPCRNGEMRRATKYESPEAYWQWWRNQP